MNPRLRKYATTIGNSAVAKRLGFLMETLGPGDSQALRKAVTLMSGFSLLDLALPRKREYNRRWGFLVNTEVEA
jgi:predicted transcriptional regulator of viral defense system